jgi:hypothetical protein
MFGFFTRRKIMDQSGDTPVVLIGGSVIVKHGSKDKAQVWSPSSPRDYHTALKQPIASIALKKHANPDHDDDHRVDDLDPATDLERIDIPHGASWKVDVFEQKSDKKAALSIASANDLGILLTLVNESGSLQEHSKRRIGYGVDSQRSELGLKDAKITKAVVSVDGKVAGTLSSIDLKSNTPGICRIVFRSSPAA